MPRSIPALAVTAALALAVAGCGGGSSSSTSAGGSAAGAGSTGSTSTSTTTPSGGSAPSGPGGSGTTAPSNPSTGSSTTPTSSGGDNSIQTYGSEAQGTDKAALIAAMRSFMRALATTDYARVCTEITASMRLQLKQFLKAPQIKTKSCAGVLSKLLHSQTAAARKAANGTITGVRIKGPTAFVLFRPAGGPPSFFVMKRDHGAWKSTSLATGTPLSLNLPGH